MQVVAVVLGRGQQAQGVLVVVELGLHLLQLLVQLILEVVVAVLVIPVAHLAQQAALVLSSSN
jgi:hypothetical protein